MENNEIKMDTFSLNDVSSGVSSTLSSISFNKSSITVAFTALQSQGVAVNLVPSICDLIEALISRLQDVGDDIEEVSFDQQIIDDELANSSISFEEDFGDGSSFSEENTSFEVLEQKDGENIKNTETVDFDGNFEDLNQKSEEKLTNITSGSQSSSNSSFNSSSTKEELKDITTSGKEDNSNNTIFEDFDIKKDELQNIVDSSSSSDLILKNFEVDHFFQFLKNVIGIDGMSLFSITKVIENEELLLSYLEEYRKENICVELPSLSLAELQEALLERCRI